MGQETQKVPAKTLIPWLLLLSHREALFQLSTHHITSGLLRHPSTQRFFQGYFLFISNNILPVQGFFTTFAIFPVISMHWYEPWYHHLHRMRNCRKCVCLCACVWVNALMQIMGDILSYFYFDLKLIILKIMSIWVQISYLTDITNNHNNFCSQSNHKFLSPKSQIYKGYEEVYILLLNMNVYNTYIWLYWKNVNNWIIKL